MSPDFKLVTAWGAINLVSMWVLIWAVLRTQKATRDLLDHYAKEADDV